MDVIRDSNVKARKNYRCNASDIFHNCLSVHDLADAEDLKEYSAATADGFKILRGQIYRCCVYKDGGELYTYRGRLDMDTFAVNTNVLTND